MERDKAWEMVKQQVKNKNLRKHMLATEAVMSRLADKLGKDREKWGLIGLIHDIDYDQTADQPEQHGLQGARMLEEQGFPDEVISAVKAHNPALGEERDSTVKKAIYAVDPVTGLVVACALVHPDKKLAALDVDFIQNRFHEKSFARGANREQIEACQELGISLNEFLELSLEAMQSISEELGL